MLFLTVHTQHVAFKNAAGNPRRLPAMSAILFDFIGFLPITLILLAVLSVLHGRARTVTTNKVFIEDHARSIKPESISSQLPVLGHLIHYLRDGPSYFSRLW